VVQGVTSTRHGDVWVQDVGGGPYSGIHLFCNYGGTAPNCPMNRTQVDAIRRGMVVNVSGIYRPFTPNQPAGAPTEVEIDAPTITATGAMMAPVAMTVSAGQVAKDVALSSTLAEQGVYVRVSAGTFSISSITPAEFVGTCPFGDAGTSYSGALATGGGHTLALGLTFYQTVTWCVPGCFACTMPLSNQSFSQVAGIVEPDSNPTSGVIYLRLSPTLDSDLSP
jgi:hypothetical protein